MYDGADLDEVADLTGLSREEVVRRHSGARTRSPTSASPRLRLPDGPGPGAARGAPRIAAHGRPGRVGGDRRTVRGRLPVPVAGRMAAARAQPAAAVGRHARTAVAAPAGHARPFRSWGALLIEVVRPGPLTTVQDLGRPGRAHLGVPRSGAADERAFRLANRLVGNPECAAALELTFGGAALRFHKHAWIAVTGAPAYVRINGRAHGTNAPCFVSDGALVEVGTPPSGLRSYLAVRGGVVVDEVLGSRSTDLLSGLGPAALSRGDRLPIGSTKASPTSAWTSLPYRPFRTRRYCASCPARATTGSLAMRSPCSRRRSTRCPRQQPRRGPVGRPATRTRARRRTGQRGMATGSIRCRPAACPSSSWPTTRRRAATPSSPCSPPPPSLTRRSYVQARRSASVSRSAVPGRTSPGETRR